MYVLTGCVVVMDNPDPEGPSLPTKRVEDEWEVVERFQPHEEGGEEEGDRSNSSSSSSSNSSPIKNRLSRRFSGMFTDSSEGGVGEDKEHVLEPTPITPPLLNSNSSSTSSSRPLSTRSTRSNTLNGTHPPTGLVSPQVGGGRSSSYESDGGEGEDVSFFLSEMVEREVTARFY